MNTKTCTVDGCDKPYEAKGWCKTHYHRMWHYGVLEHGAIKPRKCKHCGETYNPTGRRQKYCDTECRSAAGEANRLPWKCTCQLCSTHFEATYRYAKYCPDCKNMGVSISKSPENLAIYTAIRTGTDSDVLDAIRGRCTVSSAGCWEWQGHRSKSGYGRVSTGRVEGSAQESTHRLAYEYATGIAPNSMSVHHKCANRACCNPEHLQLATQIDNMAEMHARKSYEAQINELRKALALLAPDHPLLRM